MSETMGDFEQDCLAKPSVICDFEMDFHTCVVYIQGEA